MPATTHTADRILRICSQNSMRSSTRQRRRRTNANTRISTNNTKKPFTMQELNDAINQLKRGKAADRRGVNADMIKYSTRRLIKKHVLRLHSKAIKPHEQLPPNWRDTTINVLCKSGNRASPSNKRPICSIVQTLQMEQGYNPRWTPTGALTKQASDGATPRLTTFSRSSENPSLSHRAAPAAVGRSHRLQKKPPAQWNTAAYGRLRGSTASRNHTYCRPQTNEHQCTLTVKANMSISSEDPSRETRFSTLLFNSLLQYIMKTTNRKVEEM